MRPASEDLENRLSATFAALADPTRRGVLARLIRGDATVGELARDASVSGPSFSRHIKVLERAGLISRERQAQWRRCTLRKESLQEAFDWLKDYERIWEDQFNKLSTYIEQLTSGSQETPRGRPGRKRRNS
jgi:DNA-binding transcriptional ArsR family regulator